MTMTLHFEISTTETEDGRVLLGERTGRYSQLKPSGDLTLDALHGADIDQAARLLTQRYTTTPRHRVLADFRAVVAHLRTAGLVTPRIVISPSKNATGCPGTGASYPWPPSAASSLV